MSDFEQLLEKSGLKQVELAKIADVHTNTVCQWKHSCPGMVLAYLRLVIEMKRLLP